MTARTAIRLCFFAGIVGGCGGETTRDAPTSCDVLEARVKEKLDLAQSCDPSLDEPSCSVIIDGACCPEVVGADNPAAVKGYLAALEQAKQAGCITAACKAVKCALPTDGDCKAAPDGVHGKCEAVY